VVQRINVWQHAPATTQEHKSTCILCRRKQLGIDESCTDPSETKWAIATDTSGVPCDALETLCSAVIRGEGHPCRCACRDRHRACRSVYATRRRVAYKEPTGFPVDIVTQHDTPDPVW